MLKALIFTIACTITPLAAFAAGQSFDQVQCQPTENGFLPCADGQINKQQDQQQEQLTVQNNPELIQNAQHFRGGRGDRGFNRRGHGGNWGRPPYYPPVYVNPIPPYYGQPFNQPFYNQPPARFCYASQSTCNMAVAGPPGLSCSCVWGNFVDVGISGY